MPGDGRAVFGGAGDGDLELARQEGEFRVQGAPLAQHFGVGAGVDDFVRGHTGKRAAGDVADAVAAGLDAVHVHIGQAVHHIGRFVQRDPVVLQVLASGEVAVATVELTRNARELAQLLGGQHAVGHGHAQHGRMALHIPAVLQAQRTEFVVAQGAGEIALQLVAELRGAGADELAVEVGIGVHKLFVGKSVNDFPASHRWGVAPLAAPQPLRRMQDLLRDTPGGGGGSRSDAARHGVPIHPACLCQPHAGLNELRTLGMAPI